MGSLMARENRSRSLPWVLVKVKDAPPLVSMVRVENRNFLSKRQSFTLSRRITFMILGMIAGNVALYVLGTVWFMIVTGMTLEASLAACVIPFIPGNFIKMAAVAVVAPPVENAIRRTAQTNEPAV